MFNDQYGLTQAVLEGRKTNTRRVIPEKLFQECRSNGLLEAGGFNSQWKEKTLELLLAHSTYKIGEEVAIAQSYFDCGYSTRPRYSNDDIQYGDGSAGFYNKMFVRADLMPYRIKITNVRVERLQDISEEDCLNEGVKASNAVKGYWYVMCSTKSNNKIRRETARMAYADLIDAICGKGTWNSNPWVFVYDFELVK